MKNLFLFLLILSFGCRKIDHVPIEQAVKHQNDKLSQIVEGEVIVKYKPGKDKKQRVKKQTRQVKGIATDPTYLLSVSGSVEENIKALKADPDVEYAEPNYIITVEENDPFISELWGFQNAGVSQIMPVNKGSQQIYVGVIDEGIMHYHEDLCGQIWNNPFDPVDGVDNDGNGYIDDINGWDFFHKDNTIFDGSIDNHGTHVAGTIGAIGNNSKGVVGVAQNVTIISLKFLENSGNTFDAILAIDYLTDLKTRHGLNIVASNNSWGGGGYSQAMEDAIQRAGQADILFITSAGNSAINNDVTPQYPASYPLQNIISVASIASDNSLSGFSNYGASSVDIAAPGSGILSTVPAATGIDGTYGYMSGTSMAAPHVTAAVVLHAVGNPSATASQRKAAILNAATPTPSLAGKTLTGGRLNVASFSYPSPASIQRACYKPALDLIPPPSPHNFFGEADMAWVTIFWNYNDKPDSTDVVNQEVKVWHDGHPPTIVNVPFASKGLSTNGAWTGEWFNLSVRAVDAQGNTSPWSDTFRIFQPLDIEPPPAPTGLTASSPTASSILYTWTLGWDNHRNSSVKLFYKKQGESAYSVKWFPVNNSYTLSGLASGTLYDAYVILRDTTGNESQPSNIISNSTTGGIITPPPPPVYTVAATLSISGTKTFHNLLWNITTNGTLQSVTVQMKKDNGAFQNIYTGTGLGFNNVVTQKGKYTYQVIAKISQGPQSTSNQVIVNNKGK